MATHRISLLDGSIEIDSSGEVYQEPFSLTGSNRGGMVYILEDGSTRTGMKGHVEIPQNYVGSAALIVVWTSSATSGDVENDFDYRSVGGNDAESIDQATFQESVNQEDTAPSAAYERMELSISLTSANIAAGDTLEWEYYRDKSDAGDTMAADMILLDLLLEYADA